MEIIKNKIDSLQILRGFAACLVVIDHLWNDGFLPEYVVHLGGFGVDVFFVLSGFIMCLTVKTSYKNKRVNAINFLKKRIVRILPTYIICAIPFLFLDYYLKGFRDFYFYIGNLFLLPTFSGNPTYYYPLAPGWTLAYEMFYYYLFAIVLLTTKSKINIIILLVAIVSSMVILVNILGLRGERLKWINFTYMIGDTLMINFILGAIIYLIFDKLKSTNFKIDIKFSLIIFAIVLVLVALTIKYGLEARRLIRFGIPAFLVVLLFVKTSISNSNIFYKLLLIIGDASFSIYLTHYVFSKFKELFMKKVFDFNMLEINIIDFLLIILAIISGIIFYKKVEKPLGFYLNKKLA